MHVPIFNQIIIRSNANHSVHVYLILFSRQHFCATSWKRYSTSMKLCGNVANTSKFMSINNIEIVQRYCKVTILIKNNNLNEVCNVAIKSVQRCLFGKNTQSKQALNKVLQDNNLQCATLEKMNVKNSFNLQNNSLVTTCNSQSRLFKQLVDTQQTTPTKIVGVAHWPQAITITL